MKKYFNYLILFLLSIVFVLTFKYSTLVKTSIVSSCELWALSLIPSMLPIYLILDLFFNYGLQEVMYKAFKSNAVVLAGVSLLTGSPANAKYIMEFTKDNYISSTLGNFLLTFAYSPNPLFVLAMAPTTDYAFKVLAYIYITDFVIFCLLKNRFSLTTPKAKTVMAKSFVEVLSTSIVKSFHLLVIILGIVIVYGLINTFLQVLKLDSLLMSSILELTNALHIIGKHGNPFLWFTFACTFGGLSIHTQVKSILEGSSLSYKYFLLGRLLASTPLLFMILIY